MIKVTRTALLAVLFLAGIAATEASNSNSHVTLRDVSAFSVVVEDLNPQLKRYGITQKLVQTAVELRLLKAGIPVRDGVVSPYLYINVTALIHDGMVSTSISVEFKQEMYFERNPMLKTLVTTWDTGSLMVYGLRRLGELVDDIGREVDKFAHDFLAVNPKR